MLAIRLPAEIEQRLDALAKRTGRSKSYYVRAALADYLEASEDRYVSEPRGTYGDQTIRKVPEGAGEMRLLQLTAVLLPAEEGGFVALNPETGTTSQGQAISDALANLRAATKLHLEEFSSVPYGRALLTTFEIAG